MIREVSIFETKSNQGLRGRVSVYTGGEVSSVNRARAQQNVKKLERMAKKAR